LEGNHVFVLPSCITSFHLSSPRTGNTRVAFVFLSLEERNFAEVGTFQPSLGFKDLHHPCWGGERGEPELQLPRGSADHLFFQLLGVETIPQLCGGGVLQPCRGRRTIAAQLGCNIPSSVLAFMARTGARTCRCALERPALTGAALVDRRTPSSMLTWWQLEKASPPSRPSAPPTDRPLALWL
jgi:hypothetical protein